MDVTLTAQGRSLKAHKVGIQLMKKGYTFGQEKVKGRRQKLQKKRRRRIIGIFRLIKENIDGGMPIKS